MRLKRGTATKRVSVALRQRPRLVDIFWANINLWKFLGLRAKDFPEPSPPKK